MNKIRAFVVSSSIVLAVWLAASYFTDLEGFKNSGKSDTAGRVNSQDEPETKSRDTFAGLK